MDHRSGLGGKRRAETDLFKHELNKVSVGEVTSLYLTPFSSWTVIGQASERSSCPMSIERRLKD